MIIKNFISLYKNFTNNQKKVFNNFIKDNFSFLHSNNIGLEDGTIIISLFDDNKIIGCVCLLNNKIIKNIVYESDINNIDASCFDFTSDNGVFLYNLCVGKQYRNKGYGSQLIEHCVDFVKKYKLDYIHCHADNKISKSLFEKNKFIENKEFGTSNDNLAWSMSKYVQKLDKNIFYIL